MKLILKTDHTITGQNITFISPEYCISWPYHDDHLLPLPARSSSSFRAVYQFFHDIIAGISSAVFICDRFVTQAEFVSSCHSRGIRHFVIPADFVSFSAFTPISSAFVTDDILSLLPNSSPCADFVGDFVTGSFLRAIRLERVGSSHGS